MDKSTSDLLNQALALPPEGRAALADRLLESLDCEPDPEATALWDEEIARRMKQLDRGEVQIVSWAEARERLHRATAR